MGSSIPRGWTPVGQDPKIPLYSMLRINSLGQDPKHPPQTHASKIPVMQANQYINVTKIPLRSHQDPTYEGE